MLFLPLLDLCLAVVRRTALGRSPWSADRGHLHHKLLDIGYSHRGAVMLMYLWTCMLPFGGLAFAIFPWQIVLAVDLAAAADHGRGDGLAVPAPARAAAGGRHVRVADSARNRRSRRFSE